MREKCSFLLLAQSQEASGGTASSPSTALAPGRFYKGGMVTSQSV